MIFFQFFEQFKAMYNTSVFFSLWTFLKAILHCHYLSLSEVSSCIKNETTHFLRSMVFVVMKKEQLDLTMGQQELYLSVFRYENVQNICYDLFRLKFILLIEITNQEVQKFSKSKDRIMFAAEVLKDRKSLEQLRSSAMYLYLIKCQISLWL